MTPAEFNAKAEEYIGLAPLKPWECTSAAMLLLHTVAEREGIEEGTASYVPPGGTRRHSAHLTDYANNRIWTEYDFTLPRAICRCVAAWLGWGEIEEENNGQP